MPEIATTQPRLSARDRRWRAEDDARTLATAKVIMSEASRLGDAKKAAIRMAAEEKKSANAMSSVSKLSANKPLTQEPSGETKSKTRRKPRPTNTFNTFKKI